MKAPLSWINDYVKIDDIPVEELKNKLFSCGFEVEEVIEIGKNIDKIVVCRIEKIEKHPDADKLQVCQIDAGEYGKLQIITAAKNVFEGALVPVALHGATLNNGERIFKGKLRGLPSCGMFCSGEELGIGEGFYKGAGVDGILILNEDYPLGAEVKDVLGVCDTVFDINVTANRPDCQSILGLAREVAAVLERTLKMPDLSNKTEKNNINNNLSVTVKDGELCPRYMAGYVTDIKIEESPDWIKKRLFRVGVNSINNIVDITNFVLFEIGQPMHAFDYDFLENSEIIVRRADEGEKIVTLDEKEFTLNTNNLVICDGKKPVALAGIMGGLNSEIKSDTKAVVFESAKFKRDNIRKSSRALNQRSDSSARFEKGVDAYSTDIALKRALHLICELKAGKIADGIIDVCAEDLSPRTVETQTKRIDKLLGITVPDAEYIKILEKLNFQTELKNGILKVVVPPYRDDVLEYQDIAEEIIRMYGYDHIEGRLLSDANITDGGRTLEQKNIVDIKQCMVYQGYSEILSYSFYSEKEFDIFAIDKNSDEYKFIKLMNPLGEDFSVMRTSLVPSMVNTAARNLSRKNLNGKLFEIAKTYHPKALPLTELPVEKNALIMCAFGCDDFFAVKGDFENMLSSLSYAFAPEYKPCKRSYLHPTRSAEIFANGISIGALGELNPIIAEKLKIDKSIVLCEIDLDGIMKDMNTKFRYKNFSKFPSIERDLALIVPLDISHKEIVETIKSAGTDKLDKIELFDIYTGEQVQKGKKSMAYRLTFTDYTRTFGVEEVDEIIEKILESLKMKKVELR